MQNLQNSYNLIKEGKGNKELFIKQARREFPQYITNVQTFEQIVNRLKERNVISETKEIATTAEPNWFNIFNKNIQEAKAKEKKTTAEVTDIQAAGYDYSDENAMDNVFGEEFLKGYYVEMKNPKNESKTEEQIKAIVAKNLTKDSLYYVKDGQFGVKELGYTETPTKEAKGKHKSSGYGDLTENILSFNKKKKAKSALSTHLQAAKSEKNKEGENEIKKTREQIMNAKSEDELISILDDFGYDKGEIDNILKGSETRSVIHKSIKEIGMFNDPIGYEKGSKSRMEVARDILKDGGLSKEEIEQFIDGNMFKKGRIDDLSKAEVSKNKMNEGYGMSLEDAKAEAQRVSDEEGVVQHVEETEEGSGKYRVSDWYDSDLTVASYEHGNLKENAETEHTVEEASQLHRLQKLIDEVLTTKK